MSLVITFQRDNIFIGAIAGVVAGIMFGLILAAFVKRQETKLQSEDKLFEGEKVLLEGPTNHFLKLESRGGWLTLTSSKLAFRSHGKNIQNTPVDLKISDIEKAVVSATLFIIPNGLKVILKTGNSERFIVTNRKLWVEKINSLLS
ncbi:hypothetical protein KKD49_08640 [Myxococcota bacterium]|nr:hypothetical protein [Myxococcota bacterium]